MFVTNRLLIFDHIDCYSYGKASNLIFIMNIAIPKNYLATYKLLIIRLHKKYLHCFIYLHQVMISVCGYRPILRDEPLHGYICVNMCNFTIIVWKEKGIIL